MSTPTSLPKLPLPPRRPVVLCILDGVGLGLGGEDDAVATSRMPNFRRLLDTHPWTQLRAHGTAVGLPSDDDLGNSEVGHNAMGAGRVFDQGATLVQRALSLEGTAFTTDIWQRLIAARTLHLLGLLSNGNVHSHVDHLHRLIERAAVDGVRRLRVHILTDGRDVAARSALEWLVPLEVRLAEYRASGLDFKIASGGGRMHLTMDRYEADWSMVARGWAVHVLGEGRAFASAVDAVETAYSENPKLNDQFIPGFVVTDSQGPVGRIQDGDAVLFFNFRGDRAIEISRAFDEEHFTMFDRGVRPDVVFAGMMQYDGDLRIPRNYLVSPPLIDSTVSEHLARAGRHSFVCSETQKFGHVTYFFNGNRSGTFDANLENWACVPSDTLPFDQRPWMKAAEVTDAVVAAIASGRYDHVRVNYPNGDMVGHTGNLEATRIGLEAIDLQLARLEQAVIAAGGLLLITADHGNADEMWLREKGVVAHESDGSPKPRTAHTVHPVPFLLVDPRGEITLRSDLERPGLASIGATLLELCRVATPDDYLPALVKIKV